VAAPDGSIGQALATELRNLTLVVCDPVGSTELSALTDPEEYGELIQAYQHRAVTIVRALGGDVEGYSGDGILFRFGWPEAHKDDAVQALTAALDIVAPTMALSETLNIAVRLPGLAEPDTAVASSCAGSPAPVEAHQVHARGPGRTRPTAWCTSTTRSTTWSGKSTRSSATCSTVA
jgi:hypothetical protein